jgi:hypothetical protein
VTYSGILTPDNMAAIRRTWTARKSRRATLKLNGETLRLARASHPAFILVRGDRGTVAQIAVVPQADSKIVSPMSFVEDLQS